MTTTTRNEAAERLLHLIQAEHGYDFTASLDEALAAERRATVERIRLRILDVVVAAVDESRIAALHEAFAILDDEAQR